MISSLLLIVLLDVEHLDAGAEPVVVPMDASVDGATTPADAPRDSLTVESTVTSATRAVGRRRGRILAKGSRGPVSSAKIAGRTDTGSDIAADSDDHGEFEADVPCGKYSLTVKAPGFEPHATSGDACADSAPLIVRLVPRANLPLYETVVLAPRGEPSIDLRGSEMTRTPGSLGDPFRALESLPGVAVVAWPAPIFAVRGSNPGHTGFFLDEVRVPLLFHLALGPSVIHPYLFDSMTFYPGGYPSSYGRSIAGIVTAQTRPGPKDRIRATAEIRLYDAGVLAGTPWPDGNGNVVAAFRYSYTGALLSALRSDITIKYWDYQLRAERQVGRFRLIFLLFGAGDDLEYKQRDPTNDPGPVHLQFHRASLRASTALGKGQLRASLALGADESSASLRTHYRLAARSLSVMPRLTYERSSDRVDFTVGFDGHAEWLRPTTSLHEAGASDLGQDRLAVLLAGFVSAHVRAAERLTLTPGLRLDTYTISGVRKADLGPRLSARLALATGVWLTTSAGRFTQPPDVTLQIPAVGNFGLALFGLQSSWQGALGFGTHRLGVADLEVTGFVQRYVLTDLRDPTLSALDPMPGDFLVRRHARSYGLEVMLRRPASERLHGWLSYTLSKSERAMGAGIIAPSDWDQRHILNVVLGYRVGRYTLGMRGHLHTGRPVLVVGQDAESFRRVPPFYQLDLRVERRILFDSFCLDVYAEVVNATMSRETYGYHQDAAGLQARPNTTRLILPSLGIRGEL